MRSPDLAQKRDFYEVLGLTQAAGQSEIKAAYRLLARKHHPDANRGDPGAEERFKAINEAYEVLSDPQRKEIYDRFGHAGLDGRPDAGFGEGRSPFDLFDLFFGGGREARGYGPDRGADLRCDLELTLEECARGVERSIPVTRLESCSHCHGSGAQPGSQPATCPACRGSGQLRATRNTLLGTFSTVTACSRCEGRGRIVEHPCRDCGGSGAQRKRAIIQVLVPAGVDEGQYKVMRGEGEAGPGGGPPGDLYVFFHVKSHPVFERRGRDLICELSCSMTRAALGGKVQVPTLSGPQTHLLAPGTQPGDMFRLRGLGLPDPNRSGRGDLLVVVQVKIPDHLNERQRRALEEYACASGETVDGPGPAAEERDGGGLFERVRNIFGGKDHAREQDG
jgi:molecular chaperone DnaJ